MNAWTPASRAGFFTAAVGWWRRRFPRESAGQGRDPGFLGDIESLPFLEAIRQMGIELGRERTAYIHLTLVPYIAASSEIKTKPTQHSVKELRSIGIQPDILVCRSEQSLPSEQRAKIALFTNVEERAVISAVVKDPAGSPAIDLAVTPRDPCPKKNRRYE